MCLEASRAEQVGVGSNDNGYVCCQWFEFFALQFFEVCLGPVLGVKVTQMIKIKFCP